MSSRYSSTAHSRAHSQTSVYTTDERLPRTKDSEDVLHDLDVDLLISRLDKYKSDLEDAEARLHEQATFSSMKATDVAAVARFRLELERRSESSDESETGSTTSRSRASTTSTLPTRSSSLTDKSFPKASSKTPYEPPTGIKNRKDVKHLLLDLSTTDVKPQEVRSAPNAFGATNMASPRPRLGDSPALSSVKIHNRTTTIADARLQSASSMLLASPTDSVRDQHTPPIPSLSYSTSIATFRSSPRPITPLSINPPNEDQIRRELEIVSICEGPLSLVGSRRPSTTTPVLDLLELNDGDAALLERKGTSMQLVDTASELPKVQAPITPVTPPQMGLKRKKSIWTMFQRRPTVDNILDLYFDEPEVQLPQSPQRQSSKVRRFGTLRKKKPVQP